MSDDGAAAAVVEEISLPGMGDSLRYLACNFLEAKHYTKIHQSLSSKWDRMQSLSAALKLMEQHGVELSAEDIDSLAGMDETAQITALVTKMPQQSNEQFQRFFLQLQVLVSSATRIRQALENGRPDLVVDALGDADATGISSYILRMAIVQAGSEVTALKSQYKQWMRESDARMNTLIRGQGDAQLAKKKLEAAQAELAKFEMKGNDTMKKVLMMFAASMGPVLVHGCFNGWRAYTKQQVVEARIREEFEDTIVAVQKKLFEAKASHITNATGTMNKKALGNDNDLKTEIWKVWKEELTNRKFYIENEGRIKELEQKLADQKNAGASKTKNVMMRMNAGSDLALMGMVFQSLVTFHQDYLKDKEMEDQVKAAEKKVAQFMAEHAESAKKVLGSLSGGTDSGLLQWTLKAWIQLVAEAKEEAEMCELLAQNQQKMGLFQDRNKANGRNVGQKASFYQDERLLLDVFGAWRLDTRMELTMGRYQLKIDAKRQQLVGVQQMFRKFAMQLDGRMKESSDTNRDLREGAYPSKKKQLQKSEGTVSLPDINAKQTTPSLSQRSRRSSGKRSGREPAAGNADY